MNPSTTRDTATESRPTATVVPFSGAGARRFRRETDAGEPLGRILLFTGVRYERLPDTSPATTPASALPKRRRS